MRPQQKVRLVLTEVTSQLEKLTLIVQEQRWMQQMRTTQLVLGLQPEMLRPLRLMKRLRALLMTRRVRLSQKLLVPMMLMQ